MAKLKDFLDYIQPTKYIVNDDNYDDSYETPVLTAGQTFILGYTNEKDNIYDATKQPVIIFDDFTTSIQYVDFPFKVKSSAMKIIVPKNENNIKYWYYFLKTINIDSSVHKRYWISEFAEMEVDFKNIDEQNKIVEKLDKIENMINIRKDNITDLDNYVNSKYHELFDSNAEWIEIGSEFEVVTGGTPSKKILEYWENGTIPWIGSNMCSDNIIYENDGKYISEEGLKHSNAKLLPKGTVCIALIGATIGKTALLEFETTTNQNIASILVTKNENYLPEFVFYSMKMNYYIFESMGKGFNMANLKDIRALKIPKVSLDQQHEFEKIILKIELIKSELQKEINELEILLKSQISELYN